MILAKIYGVSLSQFSSLCGQSFLDFDGLIPFQENDFSKDEILSLKIVHPSDVGQNHILRTGCRYFSAKELRNLEVKIDKVKLEEEDDLEYSYLHLVLCIDYIKKYGFSPGQIVEIERIPLALSRVTIAAKYDKKIIQESNFFMHAPEALTGEEDEEIYVGKRSVVDLGGDVYGKVEYKVIICEPVSLGIVDSHTTWVILHASEESHEDNSVIDVSDVCNMGSELGAPQIETFSKSNTAIDNSSLIIANFTLPLKEIWYDKPQDHSVKLKISVDHWSDLHQSFLNSRINKLELDRNDTHCLYVSMETLVELGIQNGSWVKIGLHTDDTQCKSEISEQTIGLDAITSANSNDLSLNNEDNPIDNEQGINDSENCDARISHYGQLFEITPPEKALDMYFPRSQQTHVMELKEYTMKTRKTVHVSPLLLFNLLHGQVNTSVYSEELLLSVAPLQPEETEMSDASSNGFTTSLPYAQDAHISLISTPFTKPGDNFDDALKRHFSKPRLLTVGDIACISYDGVKDSGNSSMAEECGNVDRIYFKVKKLVVSGKSAATCMADVNHTTVYQTSAVHSYIPIDVVQYAQDKDSCNYWKLPSPPGLDVPTSELVGIIEPYLKQNINMMPAVLMSGPAGVGKGTIVMAVGRKLGLCTMNINCYDLIGESIAATETRISNVFQRAISCRPCILLLRNINILTKDRDGLEDEPRITNTLQQCMNNLKQIDSWPVVVIATSSSTTPLAAQLYSCFLHEVKLQTPTESERKKILKALASVSSVAHNVSFGLISKRTAGMVLSDFVSLFTKATNTACQRVLKTTDSNVPDLASQEGYNIYERRVNDGQTEKLEARITQEDFEDALEVMRSEHSDAIGAPKIPNVSWQDIGGLLDVKAELLDTIQLPLQHPELFASGLRRSGVLLYGPPGTGKTLLAKAVATECSLNFLSVKGPELINMYVGQSEENVRQVFSRAQSASPCVIFFDELDSLAPNRGRSGDSGGVMDRVVSQLLAELDGLHKSSDVFVIGATNRPDLLDPALLRPGRFDKLLYLGISEDHEAQLKILKALTKKFELDPDCNLEGISQQCPLNYTGADLYALCSDAMLHAIKRMIADRTDVKDGVEPIVKVKAEDFHEALRNLTPSVPEQELQRYKNIQQQFIT